MQIVKRRLFLVLIAFIGLILSHTAFAGFSPNIVVGNDDRIRLNNPSYPWTTFGKVKSAPDSNGTNAVCSGTLIGPRHVITSAHCIDVNYPYYFYPSYHNGDYAETAYQIETNVIAIYSESGVYDMSPGHGPLNQLEFTRETDWAILVLDSDVGNLFGWQEPIAWDKNWVNKPLIYNVAYPAVDASNWYGTYPMLNSSCTVRIDSGNYFWHDCDTNGGSSGSAITTMIGDRSYVIGVHNTGYGYDHCNFFEPGECGNGAIKAEKFLETWKTLVNSSNESKI